MREWMQQQAIADRLQGLEPDTDPAALDEPWRTIYVSIPEREVGDPQERKNYEDHGMDYDQYLVSRVLWGAVCEATEDRGERQAICDQVADILERQARRFPTLAEIADGLPPIEWLWPDWLPRGMLSLLGAVPGAGKSMVALDLARRIIQEDTFPDGAAIPRTGASVLYVDAEAIPQLHQSRAASWQMDCQRLYLMLPKRYGMIDLSDRWDQERLIAMMDSIGPELVVVDSLSTISSRGENNVEDVRRVLGFLSALAREYEVGLLLIHHLRKRGKVPLMDLITIDDFRGSGHIIAMSRSVLGLSIIQDTAEFNRDGPRRMEVVKTNLTRHPAPLGVRFEQRGKGVWLDYSMDAPKPYKKATEADECADWLLEVLQDAGKPMGPAEVFLLAEGAGYKQGTVRRARKLLGTAIVDTEESTTSSCNRWAVPETRWGGGDN